MLLTVSLLCIVTFIAGLIDSIAGGGGLLGRGTVNYSSAELREIAGLYVLIPAGETDAPQNRITALNETGRFLWMQFQHPCTVAEAAPAAEAQYTGQPAEMLRGIENFVRAGLRAGLLCEASAA